MGAVGLLEKCRLQHEGVFVFVGGQQQQQIRWEPLLLVHALDPSPSGLSEPKCVDGPCQHIKFSERNVPELRL